MADHGTVLILGGARRIGAGLARFLADRGYDIAIHYHRSEKAAKLLAKEIGRDGTRAATFAGDLLVDNAIPDLLTDVRRVLGRLDHIIYCASLFEKGSIRAMPYAALESHIGVHVKVPYRLCQSLMQQSFQGSIVFMTDAKVSYLHHERQVYLLSKQMMASFVKMAAATYREVGIRINAIAPGWILPPTDADAVIESEHLENMAQLNASTLLLLEQSLLVGETIYVDGGINLGTD